MHKMPLELFNLLGSPMQLRWRSVFEARLPGKGDFWRCLVQITNAITFRIHQAHSSIPWQLPHPHLGNRQKIR
jgi:hypothetical protein